jgi:hypothetical protein
MTTHRDTDSRRWMPVEVRQVNARTFRLTINRQLWSEVEWSPSRKTWCVQDAAGRCLAHCDHIVGQDIDQRTAVALAKAMIRDGRMPTPEEAERQLQERREQDRRSPTAEDVRAIPALQEHEPVPAPISLLFE